MRSQFFFVICYNVIYFRLTEALKDGGVEKALKELGLDEGNGSNGNLTDVSPSEYEGEDGGCLQIENDFRDANKSLEAALPGKEWLIFIFFLTLLVPDGVFGDLIPSKSQQAVKILNNVNNR